MNRPRSQIFTPSGTMTLASRFRLLLATHARLFIALATLDLGQNTSLLDLLLEALQSALNRLVFTDANFSQPFHPPLSTTRQCSSSPWLNIQSSQRLTHRACRHYNQPTDKKQCATNHRVRTKYRNNTRLERADQFVRDGDPLTIHPKHR